MSDTSYANVADKSRLIEILDDEWIQDSLSDDGIMLLIYFNYYFVLI